MSKHTPGPWKENKEDTGANDSGTILGPVGHVIVTDVYGRDKAEAAANALLIAAAPDLLAACKVLLKAAYESVNKDQYAPYHFDELAQAEAAIFRAEPKPVEVIDVDPD